MSCWRKRRKRTKEQEEAFQEQARRVALENGKRLGESATHPPTSPKKVRELGEKEWRVDDFTEVYARTLT